MASLGMIHPEIQPVVELGAAAGTNPLGEVRVAAKIIEVDGAIFRRSADKVVTMPGDGDPVTEIPNDDHRGILAHASYSGEKADNIQSVFGFIEGGDSKADILAAIRKAAESSWN